MMFFLLLTFFFTIEHPHAGTAPNVVVLKAERSLSTGFEQLTLTFHPAKIVMTKNSNFMDEPSAVAELGLFEGDYNEIAKTQYKLLLQIVPRLKGHIKKSSLGNGVASIVGKDEYQSPHQVIIYLGTPLGARKISQDSPYYQGLLEILSNAQDMIHWKGQDMVRAEKHGTVVSLQSKRGTGRVDHCRGVGGGRIYCPIKDYGGVYLK